MDGEKKQRGGVRPGAGRPRGSLSTVPKGAGCATLAITAARRRLRGTDDAEALECLEYIYGRVRDVLEGRVDPRIAGHVLRAAEMLADAIAGPVAEKVQHSGGFTIRVVDPYAEPGRQVVTLPPGSIKPAVVAAPPASSGPDNDPPSEARHQRRWIAQA